MRDEIRKQDHRSERLTKRYSASQIFADRVMIEDRAIEFGRKLMCGSAGLPGNLMPLGRQREFE